MLQTQSSSRRSRAMCVLVLAALLLVAFPGASLAWGSTNLQFTGVSGAILGTGSLTPAANAQTTVQISLKGFNPVGGDRALVVSQVGLCVPSNFRLYAGANAFVLPPIQFYPDGSASYNRTLTIPDWAFGGTDGSALLILADSNVNSPVIACAVVAPAKVVGPIQPPPTVPPLPPLPPAPGAPSHLCPLTPPAVPTTTVVAPAGLKLRTGPSLANATILVLPHGQTVYPIAEPTANQGISWVLVRAFRWGRCYEGYVAATYLARWAGTTPTAGEWRVTAGAGLRLRTGPGTTYTIARIVPLGTRLGFTGVEQTAGATVWVKVTVNGREFWAAKAYLERLS
jgi:uncharacterized protein YraI